MNAPIRSKTFKTGNSVAVRLPASLGVAENTPVEIERQGRRIVITETHDPEEERRKVIELVEALRALPRTTWKIDKIEFPERPDW
jgi:antitoxin VapB